MTSRHLISAETLAAHLNDPGWVVFDCRHVLTDPAAGEKAYLASHIPGALFAHLDENLAGPASLEMGRHPLPVEAEFTRWLGARGVSPETQIVAYDDAGGMYAARLWWLMQCLGHDAVAVLDGGVAAWQAQGGAMASTKTEVPQPGAAYPGTFDRGRFIELEALLPIHGKPEVLLIDARGAPRYQGKEEPLDSAPGHIPGAVNLPFPGNLDAGGRFLPPEQLKARFQSAAQAPHPRQVIHYCGSGVSACHNLLAATVAGISPGTIYVGSWGQWCADPTRPVATGENP